MASEEGYGIVPHGHRDYCGHGLVRVGRRVLLCPVEDGWPRAEDPIASWEDEEESVAFFARQPGEPVFHTEEQWELANQRLTREAVRGVLERRPAS